jgi:hypothetical protein
VLVIALIFVALPIFVLSFLAQYFLAIQLGWFKPTVGAQNDWGDLWLPAIVLGLSLYATSMRLMRSSVIDTLNQDWVRTAYSKGLSRSRVIPVHVLRNSSSRHHELRHELRRPAGRCDRHRGHLQRPRRRQHALPRGAEARGPDGRLLRHRVRDHLCARQPARRPALRAARPEDPLCQVISTTQRPRGDHYVAPATSATLVVDAVRVDEKPSNLWLDAWRDLRRRPVFWISSSSSRSSC